MSSLIKRQDHSIMDFTHFDSAMRWAKIISDSEMCPRECRGKPADILLRIEFGKSMGLTVMQSLWNISTINQRPAMWGDPMLGLAIQHPDYEWHKEEISETHATCTIKRRNNPHAIERTFTLDMAKKAGLAGKGPWVAYTERMLQMRARGFALRDSFPDIFSGIFIREEAQDTPVINPALPLRSGILLDQGEDNTFDPEEVPEEKEETQFSQENSQEGEGKCPPEKYAELIDFLMQDPVSEAVRLKWLQINGVTVLNDLPEAYVDKLLIKFRERAENKKETEETNDEKERKERK